jgi:hypothetical protein
MYKSFMSWDLSGYRARGRVADIRGPVLVAGLSLNKQETVDQLPNPLRCYVWLALIRDEGVNGTWVICLF